MFAKSVRNGGLCVAGKIINDDDTIGALIRPIWSESSSQIPRSECNFKIGDILSCNIDKRIPEVTQPENYLLRKNVDDNTNIKQINGKQKLKWSDFLDNPDILWNSDNSSNHGYNDRIQECSDIFSSSLFFIAVKDPVIIKQDETWDSIKHKLRMIFFYNNIKYKLVVTDTVLYKKFYTLEVGEKLKLASGFVTISLALPYKGFCYKLVAGYVSA